MRCNRRQKNAAQGVWMLCGAIVAAAGICAAAVDGLAADAPLNGDGSAEEVYAPIKAPICPRMAARMGLLSEEEQVPRAPMKSLPPFEPPDGPTNPMGVARGIFPGRVVWDYDPSACLWDGRYTNGAGAWLNNNYQWLTNNTDQAKVDAMVSRCLRWLTGTANDSAAWQALFVHFNVERGVGSNGYVNGEGVSIKPNWVNCWSWVSNPYADKPNQYYRSMTIRQVILSVLRQLVNNAGVPQQDVTVYCDHVMPHFLYTYFTNEFPNVRYYDRFGQFGRGTNQNDYANPIYPSSGKLPTDWPADSLSRSKYAINVPNLKTHEAATGGNNPDGGTNAEFPTLCAKNHFGSLVNGAGQYHDDLEATNAYATYHILPDLMEHKKVGGHTLLYVVDGLYGGLGHWDSLPKRWLMEPFNSNWPASIMMSQDEVAMDSVGTDFLRFERELQNDPLAGSVDHYLHEAALITNPPSGIVYDPDGDGPPQRSLGVHEHWTDPVNRFYSRNLGLSEGIELFTWEPLTAALQPNTSNVLPNCPVFLRADVRDHGRLGRNVHCWWDTDGDGTPDYSGVDLFTVTARYAAAGSVIPRLTLSNELGEVSALAFTNKVAVLPAVVAGFSMWPTNGQVPLTVYFTDESHNTPQYWYWDFGNGTSTERNPTNVYAIKGDYSVTLVVSNDLGEVGWSSSVTVHSNAIVAVPEPGLLAGLLALVGVLVRRRG